MKHPHLRRVFRGLALIALMIALPALGYAQEATLTGTVRDTTGGVLPGVTVTALHEATGNTFVAVTDDVGAFRLLMRTGSYRITVELAGFAHDRPVASICCSARRRSSSWSMSPSTVQESVTVTGEAPLIDTHIVEPAGNIDPKQMQELPINGRNWMDLAMLAPGSRQNAVERRAAAAAGHVADQHRRSAGHEQLHRHRRRPAAIQPRLDRRVRGASPTASTRRRAGRPA